MSLHRSITTDGTHGTDAPVLDIWSFGEFWARAVDAIGIHDPGIEPGTSLHADLELDSLHMAELVVFIDELGCELPEDLIPVLETAGDIYDHYVTRITAEAHRGAP